MRRESLVVLFNEVGMDMVGVPECETCYQLKSEHKIPLRCWPFLMFFNNVKIFKGAINFYLGMDLIVKVYTSGIKNFYIDEDYHLTLEIKKGHDPLTFNEVLKFIEGIE